MAACLPRLFFTEISTLNSNPIQEAVRRAGGPSRVAAELRVSSRAINTWQNKGYVPKYDAAEQLARLADMPLESLRKL